MKTLTALALAALMLATASATSHAGKVKKKPVHIQAATTINQTSIRHLRLRSRVLPPPTILMINQ
jgi:methionine-rich copper-binding protein CopC